MELTYKDYKYINNKRPNIKDIAGELPKYGTGTIPASIYNIPIYNFENNQKQDAGDISPFQMIQNSLKEMDDSNLARYKREQNKIADGTFHPTFNGEIDMDAQKQTPLATSAEAKNKYDWQNQIQSSLPFIGDIWNSYQFNDTERDLLGRTHSDYGSVDGIKYKLNSYVGKDYLDEVDNQSWANIAKSTISGATMGMNTNNNIQNFQAASSAMKGGGGSGAGGGFGDALGSAIIGAGAGFIGSIFSLPFRSSKAEELRNKTNRYIDRTNTFAQNYALSQASQQNYYKRRGLGTSQMLRVSGGQDPRLNPVTGESINDYLVDTDHGRVKGPQNGWVEQDERMVDMREAENGQIPYIHKVNHGPNDRARAYLTPYTAVFSKAKTNPITGNSIADDVEQYAAHGKLWDLLDIQNSVPNKNNLMKAKNGKCPRFNGGIEPWLANLPTMLVGLGQYIKGSKESPYKFKTFVPNAFLQKGMNDLYGLRVSSYPMMQNVYKLYGNAINGINMSGGLSGGQKTLARLSALKGTQRAIAEGLMNNQMQNNAYISDAAKTGISAYGQEANRATQSQQFDEDVFMKSNAAKQQMTDMGLYNILSGWGSVYKDYVKNRQFRDTISLYRDEQNLKRDELEMLKNSMNAQPAMTYDMWKKLKEQNHWT